MFMNPHMRILQLVQKPQRRGAEIFAYQQSKEMRVQGHTVKTVYLYPYTADNVLELEADDCVLGGTETHWQEKIPGIHRGLLSKLRNTIAEFQPDVVQVNGARTVKYGAFAKRFDHENSWVLIYRNIDNPTYWVNSRFHLWFYKQLVMPQLDGIVGVSQATLQSVHHLYRTTAPARVIPNGVDIAPLQNGMTKADTRKDLCKAVDGPIVLFMGNLTTQKRPDRFLRIVHRLRQEIPAIQGWFLGDGPQRSALTQQVEALQLQRNIHFWGYQAAIAPYITAADLLLVTSDSDGIPAVVLEAGFLGKPTVGTRVGGMAECVLDGETGLLVASQDEAGFADAVSVLLRDPARRATMGQRAKTWVRENFAMDKIAGQYLAFYAQVLSAVRDKG